MDKNFTIKIHYGWSVKKYRNAEKDIDATLKRVAEESIGELLKQGKTSGDLNHVDSNGNKYIGIISMYHTEDTE